MSGKFDCQTLKAFRIIYIEIKISLPYPKLMMFQLSAYSVNRYTGQRSVALKNNSRYNFH